MQELAAGKQELATKQTELTDGKVQLQIQEEELNTAKSQLEEQAAKLEEQKSQLEEKEKEHMVLLASDDVNCMDMPRPVPPAFRTAAVSSCSKGRNSLPPVCKVCRKKSPDWKHRKNNSRRWKNRMRNSCSRSRLLCRS